MSRWVTRKTLALAGGTCLFALALWRWHADSAIASWVQAGFSVLAIVAAIWVAEMQVDRQRLLELSRAQATQVNRLEAILAICRHAAYVLVQVAERRADRHYIDKPQMRRIEVSQLEDARTALANIPLHSVAPWSVAEAVLALLRCTGDVREAINNSPLLTSSWTAERSALFEVNSKLAQVACTAVQNALNSVASTSTMPEIAIRPPPDTASLVEAANAPSEDATGESTVVHVQFSDSTYRDIISYFGGPQDPNVHPNLATIHSSDARYSVWYYALPESARLGLPKPTQVLASGRTPLA